MTDLIFRGAQASKAQGLYTAIVLGGAWANPSTGLMCSNVVWHNQVQAGLAQLHSLGGSPGCYSPKTTADLSEKMV
jgi:hypothetical protein